MSWLIDFVPLLDVDVNRNFNQHLFYQNDTLYILLEFNELFRIVKYDLKSETYDMTPIIDIDEAIDFRGITVLGDIIFLHTFRKLYVYNEDDMSIALNPFGYDNIMMDSATGIYYIVKNNGVYKLPNDLQDMETAELVLELGNNRLKYIHNGIAVLLRNYGNITLVDMKSDYIKDIPSNYYYYSNNGNYVLLNILNSERYSVLDLEKFDIMYNVDYKSTGRTLSSEYRVLLLNNGNVIFGTYLFINDGQSFAIDLPLVYANVYDDFLVNVDWVSHHLHVDKIILH